MAPMPSRHCSACAPGGSAPVSGGGVGCRAQACACSDFRPLRGSTLSSVKRVVTAALKSGRGGWCWRPAAPGKPAGGDQAAQCHPLPPLPLGPPPPKARGSPASLRNLPFSSRHRGRCYWQRKGLRTPRTLDSINSPPPRHHQGQVHSLGTAASGFRRLSSSGRPQPDPQGHGGAGEARQGRGTRPESCPQVHPRLTSHTHCAPRARA